MRQLLVASLLCGISTLGFADDSPKSKGESEAPKSQSSKPESTRAAKPDRAALEKEFTDKLAGATLVGTFTTDGKSGANPDRYRVVSARKVIGDDWVFTATMKVAGQDLDIPIPIKVYWADDTPVMSLTDLTIPGVGTFTARVMFYGNRYAGTWQHGDHGGTFAGIIEPKASTDASKKDGQDKPGSKDSAKE